MRAACMLVALALGAGGCGNTTPGAAMPVIFMVTSADDAGPGTLRELIDTVPAGSIISFQPALPDITLASVLTITREMTIQGPGAPPLAVDGGGAGLFAVAAGVTCEISDLTLKNGGRGVDVLGTATVRRVIFDNCNGGFGGAFDIVGSLTLEDCTIRNCSAFNGGGGGVNKGGNLLARRCVWHNNMTTGNSGGALALTDGVAVCVNCTFSTNMATGGGAGGAIAAFDEDSFSDVTLIHCTVVLNSAGGNGGGIATGNSNLTCRACILAGNATGGTGPDVNFGAGGTFTTAGRNVVGIDAGSPFVDGVMNDQVGTVGTPLDPMLGPLMDNGGPTLTHGLAAGPARDQVPPGECLDENGDPLTTDQRNAARPSGLNVNCDTGAFEF